MRAPGPPKRTLQHVVAAPCVQVAPLSLLTSATQPSGLLSTRLNATSTPAAFGSTSRGFRPGGVWKAGNGTESQASARRRQRTIRIAPSLSRMAP